MEDLVRGDRGERAGLAVARVPPPSITLKRRLSDDGERRWGCS